MDALEILFHHARSDTGGSRRCAMFLLSLWNGANFKADLQDLLYNDPQIFRAMIEVLSYLYKHNQQHSSLVSQSEIEPVMKLWGRAFWDSPEPFPFPETQGSSSMEKTRQATRKAAVRRNGSGAYVLLVEDADGVMWERASSPSAGELAK